ncbi:MAG TPA: hypothetical protein VGG61_14960 [Gemmataceae bacterium]|jgi:hypothetical protein
MEPKAEEWFANEHREGVFPPGLWACAGQLKDLYGLYLGAFEEIQDFIPESRIPEYIASLRSAGEMALAQMLENLQEDVVLLRTGRERLARDLAGRKIHYDR